MANTLKISRVNGPGAENVPMANLRQLIHQNTLASEKMKMMIEEVDESGKRVKVHDQPAIMRQAEQAKKIMNEKDSEIARMNEENDRLRALLKEKGLDEKPAKAKADAKAKKDDQ